MRYCPGLWGALGGLRPTGWGLVARSSCVGWGGSVAGSQGFVSVFTCSPVYKSLQSW